LRRNEGNYLRCLIRNLHPLADYSNIEVFCDGFNLEFYATSASGEQKRLGHYTLELSGNLRMYLATKRNGPNRTPLEILNIDCEKVIID